MKLLVGLGLAVLPLPFMGSIALANESLGHVIRDSIRDEIRDDIRDSVRRDLCRRREERDRNPDLCNTLEDIDQLRDGIRRGTNGIRVIDAILN
ncbi:hypothetical protein [Leptolyngbya sp. KIOST-1]|uniref:hypothetical protein n=1 Tax=Leptolyngbya sp. KIOST-1 TaxID=1229172 RepID=UPI000A49B916|nr:hypothetical protein [Leptolyngbya sp. KIOST-1]